MNWRDRVVPAIGFAGCYLVIVAMIWLCVASCGCASSPAKLTRAAVAGQELVDMAQPRLVRWYQLEQKECYRLETEPQQQACIDARLREWKQLEATWLKTMLAVCDLDLVVCEVDK